MKQRRLGSQGLEVSELGLGWVHGQGSDMVPIPGTTRPERLDENVGALGIELTDDDFARLDEIAPLGAAAGERLPGAMMDDVNR